MFFDDNSNLYKCSCFTQYESRKAEAYFDENFERKEFSENPQTNNCEYRICDRIS